MKHSLFGKPPETSVDERASALEAMATLPVGVVTPAEEAREEERLVPWLEARIAGLPLEAIERERRAARRRWVALGLSVAAVIALGFGLRGWVDRALVPANSLQATERARPLDSGISGSATLLEGELESGGLSVLRGSRLGMHGGLRTTDGSVATLRAAEGYTFVLGKASGVRLLPESNPKQLTLELASGSIELSVPKLGESRSLAVVTADARVTVHGTRFQVIAPAEATSATCVRVTEGKVEVARGGSSVFLLPGQSSGCDDASAARVSDAEHSGPEVARVGRSVPRGVTTLAQENALLAEALSAERAGDAELARKKYRDLLERYPNSRFSPEARSGLGRLDAKKR